MPRRAIAICASKKVFTGRDSGASVLLGGGFVTIATGLFVIAATGLFVTATTGRGRVITTLVGGRFVTTGAEAFVFSTKFVPNQCNKSFARVASKLFVVAGPEALCGDVLEDFQRSQPIKQAIKITRSHQTAAPLELDRFLPTPERVGKIVNQASLGMNPQTSILYALILL